MPKNEILIFLPTYNEAGHVPIILERIQATGVKADVVFLDDNSTDGTRDIIDGFAAKFDNVFAIHRTGKLGIGSAHLDGIRYAYDKGYQILVTMDSDLVHKPEDIPAFLEASDKADVVIGTRFEMKNSLAEWNLFRKTLTHLGHMLTRLLLRHDFDSTGGFRAYRLDKIRREAFDLVKARDYEFFYTSLTILHLNGHPIAEIPIELPGRAYGHSKMQLTHMAKSVLLMVKLGIKCQLFRTSLLLEKHPEE
jgi:dolichol-phosphate mannosyltransferase